MNNTSSSSSSLPLISVVVTTYNRQLMLQDAIESILNQTYTNYEIIVINDYGKDVWDLIQSVNTEKMLYLSTIKNSGPAFARNTAHNIAKGEYICYLDDDDEFLPMHLETAVKYLSKNKVDIVYTNALYVDEVIVNNKRIIKREYTNRTFSVFSNENLLISNFIPINTLTYRATLVNGIEGFDETLASFEDWEFFLCLARLTSFLHIDQDTIKSGYSQRVWWLFKQNTDKGLNLFFDFIKSGLQYFFLLSRYTCFKFFVKCFVRLRYES